MFIGLMLAGTTAVHANPPARPAAAARFNPTADLARVLQQLAVAVPRRERIGQLASSKRDYVLLAAYDRRYAASNGGVRTVPAAVLSDRRGALLHADYYYEKERRVGCVQPLSLHRVVSGELPGVTLSTLLHTLEHQLPRGRRGALRLAADRVRRIDRNAQTQRRRQLRPLVQIKRRTSEQLHREISASVVELPDAAFNGVDGKSRFALLTRYSHMDPGTTSPLPDTRAAAVVVDRKGRLWTADVRHTKEAYQLARRRPLSVTSLLRRALGGTSAPGLVRALSEKLPRPEGGPSAGLEQLQRRFDSRIKRLGQIRQARHNRALREEARHSVRLTLRALKLDDGELGDRQIDVVLDGNPVLGRTRGREYGGHTLHFGHDGKLFVTDGSQRRRVTLHEASKIWGVSRPTLRSTLSNAFDLPPPAAATKAPAVPRT
jgi:hypothetical protein